MINEKQAQLYCCEDINRIENYEAAIADNSQTWDCHHRLEIQGEFRNSYALLKKCGLYYNVPAWQLIFLTHSEHQRLHWLGKHHSEEAKRKNREAHLGKRLSEEAKQKNREAHLGKRLSEETRRKISEALKRRKQAER